MKKVFLFCSALLAALSSKGQESQLKDWMLGPFYKIDEVNPILRPAQNTVFRDPMRNTNVAWEAMHVFNPAAVVKDNKVYLLYRAEDSTGTGIGGHTSRIGLAVSEDGKNFKRYPHPVVYPANDISKKYEWDGGCEDPRVVQSADGTFVMTYTMWDRKLARIGVATSKDLIHWTKHGSAFEKAYGGKFKEIWSKSASVICELKGGKFLAKKINGKYWMYWNEATINLATSTDLVNWTPVLDQNGELLKVFTMRKGKFDSGLVEPGPPAVVTDKGIVFLYNGKNAENDGDPDLPVNTYSAGQALLDPKDPAKLLDRSDVYFIKPEKQYEITGQYTAGTVFIEGLVYFKNRWLLYYGTADSKVAVAESKK
ncbi:glycoside hydrolase family 130 protein [Rubrolithibacter danxiaensis]|uniref:glycoside hydrolase family 130 protein n=1 Tax=Rubrolithibacter danxiaensis TaxID=3390805 RepID=UPI003BF79572